MGRVEGKIAIVTGGASGLGRAAAALLAREGAHVTITDVNEPAGAATAQEIGARFHLQDVADEADWVGLIDAVVAEFGGLDILVNNAGIGAAGPGNDPETTTLETWNRVITVNATSTFLGCKHAIGAMRDTGGGSIVNLSSIAALVATPFITAYGASKAAVRQLTMSVALHCGQRGYNIRCNSIHPGQISTPMHDQLSAELAAQMGVSAEHVRAQLLKKIPLGEMGQPDDVAYAVLYLASDESKHVTGAQLVVDGGMNLNP